MANTSDLRIIYHDDALIPLVYLPGSNTPLSAGSSVITPDHGIGIVQAIYPVASIAAVAVFEHGRDYQRKEYPLNRLTHA